MLSGDVSADETVLLLEAVEGFEQAVEAAGGDLMNLEKNDDPEDHGLTIPTRSADEGVRDHIARVVQGTIRLRRG